MHFEIHTAAPCEIHARYLLLIPRVRHLRIIYDDSLPPYELKSIIGSWVDLLSGTHPLKTLTIFATPSSGRSAITDPYLLSCGSTLAQDLWAENLRVAEQRLRAFQSFRVNRAVEIVRQPAIWINPLADETIKHVLQSIAQSDHFSKQEIQSP
jgi:hypothetical protein